MVWKSAVCCCLAIFLLCLINVAQVRGDCTRPSFSGNIVLDEESVKDSYADGETAKVKCAIGYVPVDAGVIRSITCSGTQWTKPLLECKKKPCGNPGEVTNGWYVMPDGIDFGATITAECHPGYRIVGVNIRRCYEYGWSGRALECEAIKCLKPANINNGRFDPVEDSYDFGRVLSYSCVSSDYTLVGSEEITCSENGTFHPDPPECLVANCTDPDVPHGEKVEGKMSPPYTYRNFIKYRCDDGYRMKGSETITCVVKGWNPAPPRCEEVTCGAPEVKNAKPVGNHMGSYQYKGSVKIECNEGYKLNGADTMTCGYDGWSPSTVRCLEVTCVAPVVKNAKQIGNQMESYRYKSTAKFECNEGYRLNGADMMTCETNGWSPSTLQCQNVTCVAPEVKNAKLFGNKVEPYLYNSSVRFECNKGYKLNSSDTLTCGYDGWSPSTVQCLADKAVSPGSHGNSQKPSTVMIAAIVVVLLLGLKSH